MDLTLISCIQWNRIYTTILKGRNGSIVRKYWNTTRLQPSKVDFKSCSSISDVEELSWLHLSSVTAYKTHLPLGLIPLSLCSFPWKLSQGSGISDTLGLPIKSRLHFCPFMLLSELLVLSRPSCSDSPATHISYPSVFP